MRIIIITLLGFCFFSCSKEPVKLKGHAFGTTSHITYYDAQNRDFTKQIDSLFYLVNKSMSTYLPTSDISKINQGDTTVMVDAYFAEVFQKSARIYKETQGVFDPTIGVLVNAWGFGPKKPIKRPDSLLIKQLLTRVGFDKVQLKKNKIIKSKDSIYFDFNAIAKGYAADVVGRYFETKNCYNYLIEIGGDIRTKGKNKENSSPWRVGVENPSFDGSRSIQKVILLENKAMATSGSYRKFKTDSITGEKYAHILSTKTGYPSRSNLLSVSVIAALDLADVDGYATALMAMTLEQAKIFLERHKELEGFIIFTNKAGEIKTFSTQNEAYWQ